MLLALSLLASLGRTCWRGAWLAWLTQHTQPGTTTETLHSEDAAALDEQEPYAQSRT